MIPNPYRLATASRFATVGLLALAALAVCIAPASAQPDRSAAIRERLKTRPDDATLYYYLSASEIAAGNKAAGIEALRQVGRLAKGFLPVRDMGFEPVWDDSAFRAVRDGMEKQLPKVTTARELFRLDKTLIPEGIAYDPVDRSFYVGSVATRRIVRVDSAGTVSNLSKAGELRPVLGLAVDAKLRRLYAVSTSALTAGPGDTPVNEIVAYDLVKRARMVAFPVPAAAQLNDVTVSSRGDVYATDSQGGGVFRIRAEDGVVDTLVAPGTLPGANGLAVSSDGAALFVAHSTGIGRVELAGGAVLPRIAAPKDETIAAIDGLYVDGADLIGVQNVTNPGRVIRIRLSADGKTAERVETLLSHHHPAIDEPTTGVVVGRTFVLLATTQVARFTPQGTIASPETLKPPVVLSIPLDRADKPAPKS